MRLNGKTWWLQFPVLIYCFWSALFILQKPGLQYDEAFLVSAAVHMRHPAEPYTLSESLDLWVCPLQHCLPLMGGGSQYVGAIKDYLALPLFALFGVRATVIRFLAMLLGAVGIWGVSILVRERAGVKAAVVAALILAMNPAYVTMTIFDNNAVGPMMAGLGLVCAALAGYLRRRSVPAAFLFGLAAGFAIWTRANFVWVLAAGFIAALIVFRSQIMFPARDAPAKHWIAIVCGSITGGFPFLLYQFESGGGTWKAQGLLVASQSFTDLMKYRLFLLQDLFLSEGEHRTMWGNGSLPRWQMWLFPAIVVSACLVCLIARPQGDRPRRADAQFAALSLAILGAYLLLQRLVVAEHHLIVLVPLAAAVVTMAGLILCGNRWGRLATIALALIYSGSALYWQIAGIRGLKSTGGVGLWSDAGLDLARYIDQNDRGREITILDWGYETNLYVLTDGRLRSTEIYSHSGTDQSRRDLSWADEIQAGGLFLLDGPDYRQFPASPTGFSRALAATRPTINHIYTASQRDGAIYAQLIDIEPNSLKERAGNAEPLDSSLSMGDPDAARQLHGFYQIEGGGWRWTSRNFAVRLATPASPGPTCRLSIRLTIPEAIIRSLGSVTLSGQIGDHALRIETWRQSGDFTFERDIPASWLAGPATDVQFALDRTYPAPPPDNRALGIIVHNIAISPR